MDQTRLVESAWKIAESRFGLGFWEDPKQLEKKLSFSEKILLSNNDYYTYLSIF